MQKDTRPAPQQSGTSAGTNPPQPAQKTLDDISQDLVTRTKDDSALAETWHAVVLESSMMWKGKPAPVQTVVNYFHSRLAIPIDPTIMDCAKREASIGNLLMEVDFEVAVAEQAARNWTSHRKKFLARGKDRRKAQAVLEAELIDKDLEFRTVAAAQVSAENNYHLWKQIRCTCLDALDRLRQISIAITADMKSNSPQY